MAVGRNPIVGFDPDPDIPGAGMLKFEDGSELYGDDPQLAANIEAAAPPDARVAGPAFAPEPPPVNETQAGINAYAEGFDDLEAKRQQEEQAAAQAAADEEERQRQRYLDTTVAVPYRPGVSKQQLEQQAESGTAIPVGESVQHQVGVGDSPEDQEERAQADFDRRFAAARENQVQVQALENKQKALEIQGNQLQSELRDQRYVEQFAEKRADRMFQISEDAAEAYRNHDINPPPNSPMKDLGLAVMQAFGAYAAILGGGPNHAAAMIDNIVEREVAQRKLEHDQLGETADNLYSQYVRAVGDAELAEDMYRDTQQRFAMIQMERTATEFGLDLQDAQFQGLLSEYELQRQEREREIREKAQGKIMRNVQSQVEYPRAASGGGRRRLTDDEILERDAKRSRLQTEIDENRAKSTTARATVEGGGVAPDKASEQLAKKEERWVEGFGAAATKEEAIRVREAKAAAQSYRNNLLKAKDLAKSPKAHIPGTDEYEQYKIVRDNIKLALAKRGGGIVTQSDYDIAEVTSPKQGLAAGAAQLIADQSTNRIDALLDQSDNLERELIREAVQGQHPELPQRGVAEE